MEGSIVGKKQRLLQRYADDKFINLLKAIIFYSVDVSVQEWVLTTSQIVVYDFIVDVNQIKFARKGMILLCVSFKIHSHNSTKFQKNISSVICVLLQNDTFGSWISSLFWLNIFVSYQMGKMTMSIVSTIMQHRQFQSFPRLVSLQRF